LATTPEPSTAATACTMYQAMMVVIHCDSTSVSSEREKLNKQEVPSRAHIPCYRK